MMIKTMSIANMKIFSLLSLTVNFLSILHFSTAECTTATKCLEIKLDKTKPLEIGILYDLTGSPSQPPPESLLKLDGIVCAVIKASGGIVTLKRRPGATVTEVDGQIKCADDCFLNREDGCKGQLEPEYLTNCDGATVSKSALINCMVAKESDQILEENGALRCQLGIPESKLPALTFNNEYEPCTDFQTTEDLQTFVCSIYDSTIPGC